MYSVHSAPPHLGQEGATIIPGLTVSSQSAESVALCCLILGRIATPNLLLGDVTGFNMFYQKSHDCVATISFPGERLIVAEQHDFDFRRGPVFSDVFLAATINRAIPRIQSSLLEAMAERQVNVD